MLMRAATRSAAQLGAARTQAARDECTLATAARVASSYHAAHWSCARGSLGQSAKPAAAARLLAPQASGRDADGRGAIRRVGCATRDHTSRSRPHRYATASPASQGATPAMMDAHGRVHVTPCGQRQHERKPGSHACSVDRRLERLAALAAERGRAPRSLTAGDVIRQPPPSQPRLARTPLAAARAQAGPRHRGLAGCSSPRVGRTVVAGPTSPRRPRSPPLSPTRERRPSW